MSATGEKIPMPALLTRMSAPPASRSTSRNRLFTASCERTSQASPTARPPTSRAAAAAAVAPRAVRTTVAPSAFSASTMPRPMPRFPPVTTATLPSRKPTAPLRVFPQPLHRLERAGVALPLVEHHAGRGQQVSHHHGPGHEPAHELGAERQVHEEEADLEAQEQHQQDEEHDREALEQGHEVRQPHP